MAKRYYFSAGQGSMFQNPNKTMENQPDYKGTIVDVNGIECWISAWVQNEMGKTPFLNVQISKKKTKEQIHNNMEDTE